MNSVVSVYIKIQKISVSLQASNKLPEKLYMKTIPFTIAQNQKTHNAEINSCRLYQLSQLSNP